MSVGARYPTQTRSRSNVCWYSISNGNKVEVKFMGLSGHSFLDSPFYGVHMMTESPISGCFYFISDQFYIDFPDPYLMPNKSSADGRPHNRPCFYAFEDTSTGLYWVIPISSRIAKYQSMAEKKIKRYGRCDTILFGEVLGHNSAFLIQNMFPTTAKYLENLYVNSKDNVPVRVDGAFEAKLLKSARRVIFLVHKNIQGLIFPDVLAIEKALLVQK